MRNFNKLALIVVLGSGFAVAQSTPASQSTAPSTAPSSTQQPSTPEQQPSTAPDQGKNPANAPEQMPSTDQKKTDQQTPDQTKMPQSDAAPTATGDVQSTIQSAIQKDPTLASASVNVVVNAGKSVELTGTVPTKDAKDAAERIAKENSGGLKVKNHLKIAAAPGITSEKPKSDLNPKL
ncbi:MAG: BON domain-containing protein [Candidatus Angelobacter sp.]